MRRIQDNHLFIKKGVFSIVLLIMIALVHFGVVDDIGRGSTESGFKRALLTFGIARGLNGVISVAQGTEVALQPAGMGVIFTPGQILDPVNDLVERFSWVMLACSTSLGAQRVLLDITAWPGFTVFIAVLFCIILLATWLPETVNDRVYRIACKSAAILLILRFAIPVVAIANEGVYHHFLAPQYEHSKQQLEQTTDTIGRIHRASQENLSRKPASLLDEARHLYESASRQIDIDARVEEYKAAAANVSEYTINLIVVFVLQTIVFPLISIWLVIQFIKRIVTSVVP